MTANFLVCGIWRLCLKSLSFSHLGRFHKVLNDAIKFHEVMVLLFFIVQTTCLTLLFHYQWWTAFEEHN